MFKFIKALGRIVIKFYNVEARRLNEKARAEAKLAQSLAKRVQELTQGSIDNTAEAAKVAAQAQKLKEFFNE